MIAVYYRELKRFFATPFASLICAALLLSEGVLVILLNLISGYTSLSPVLTAMQWALIVLLPPIAARSQTREHQKQTDVLLYALPIRRSQVVLGKYFAALTLFLIPTAALALCPVLLLSSFGKLPMPTIYLSLLGYLLMGAALLSITFFVSSLARTQAVAVILGVGALLALYLLGMLASLLPEQLAMPLASAMPFAVFGGFTYGHLDLSGTVYYLTVTAFFLYAAVCATEKRRNA